MARTSTKAAMMKSTEFTNPAALINTQKSKIASENGHHKRSVSDSNAIFHNFAANQTNRIQSGAIQGGPIGPSFESTSL